MNWPVLCFDRDQTLNLNPPQNGKAVPLSWVQYYAHFTNLDVWATGNQQLQIEAGVPTPYEASQMLKDDGHSVRYDPSGSHQARRNGLQIIEKLYSEVYDNPSFLVVDDANLTAFAQDTKWQYYSPAEFVSFIKEGDSELPDPDTDLVSGETYNNTTEHGTYDSMMNRLSKLLQKTDS